MPVLKLLNKSTVWLFFGDFELIKNTEDIPSSPSHQNTIYYYDCNANKPGHPSVKHD